MTTPENVVLHKVLLGEDTSSRSSVHIYKKPEGDIVLQVRRLVESERSLSDPSFKVAVPLTPEKATEIAHKLLAIAGSEVPQKTTTILGQSFVIGKRIPLKDINSLDKGLLHIMGDQDSVVIAATDIEYNSSEKKVHLSPGQDIWCETDLHNSKHVVIRAGNIIAVHTCAPASEYKGSIPPDSHTYFCGRDECIDIEGKRFFLKRPVTDRGCRYDQNTLLCAIGRAGNELVFAVVAPAASFSESGNEGIRFLKAKRYWLKGNLPTDDILTSDEWTLQLRICYYKRLT